MSWDWWLPVAVGLLALLAVGLGVGLARLRGRTRRELEAARAEAAELRVHLEDLERRVQRPVVRADQEFRITSLGDPVEETAGTAGADAPADAAMDRQQFTDLLLRESVVKVGSLAYGVRRALSPEVRNRIRFEVRREVKRSRKARKDEVREAVREWRARQRADVADDPADDVRHSA